MRSAVCVFRSIGVKHVADVHSYWRRKLVSCLSVRCAGLEDCIDLATAPAFLEPDARNRTTQRQIGYTSKFAAVRPFLKKILANELSQFVSTAVSRLLVTSSTSRRKLARACDL